jgi:RNA polymerase sigma-70 factor (ECF subfamily)
VGYRQVFFIPPKQNRESGASLLLKGCHRGKSESGQTGAQGVPVEERQAIELFLRDRTEESFCALFEALYAKLRRYFLLRSLDAMTAEELAQNVMLAVYRHAGEVRDRGLFHGWLFKVARNELLQHWRQHPPGGRAVAFEPLTAELAEKLSAEAEPARDSRLSHWLAHLAAEERELILLRFVEGLSYEELAAALEAPLGTIKWRLFNVKQKLSQIILGSPEGGVRKRIGRL